MRAFLFVVLASFLSTCTTAPSLLDQIVARGELRVVTRNSPTTFFLGPQKPQGIEYDLARGFAERLGVDLIIDTADQPGQVLPTLFDGRAHVAAAGLTIDADAIDAVQFGPDYQSSAQQVIYRRGARRPKSIEDLQGGRLSVTANPEHVRSLELARLEHPDLTWSEDSVASVEELVKKVSNGEIDYTVVDSNLFAILRQYHPEAREAFQLSETKPIAWAIPDNAPKLREAVAAYFAEIKATGELNALVDKYYFAARNFDYVGSRAFVRHMQSRLPQYQRQFQEAAEQSGFDWRLLAAIAYQESHWRHDAVSPTGVRGIMMLTEDAASTVKIADREDPHQSIVGGARYLARMVEKIPERIAEKDRLWMALAAYNIGFGHLEDARIITQMNGGDADSWDEVREHLPLLTDENWHSRVRRGYARGDVPVLYVDNVKRYYQLLQWAVDDAPPADTPNILPIDRGQRTAQVVTEITAAEKKTL